MDRDVLFWRWRAAVTPEQIEECAVYRFRLRKVAHVIPYMYLQYKFKNYLQKKYCERWKDYVLGSAEITQKRLFVSRYERRALLYHSLQKLKRAVFVHDQMLKVHVFRAMYPGQNALRAQRVNLQKSK